jgi:hypothetical protein
MDSSKRMPLAFAIAIGIIAALVYYYANGLVPRYQYRTDVSVGEFARGDSLDPIEPAAVMEVFVRDTLLIAPTTDELKKLGVREAGSSALITVIEAGKSLRIRSTAAESDVALVKAVHQFVADGILNRLKGRATYLKSRLEGRLAEAQEKLQFALNDLAVFSEIGSDAKASEGRVRELARNLSNEISEHDRPQQSPSPPAAAEGEGPDLSKRGQLAMYQKLGLAEIPLLRAKSAQTIVDLEQAVAQLRQAIRDLNEQIAVFREPAVTLFMERSISPVGSSRLLTLLVGLLTCVATFVAVLTLRRWSRKAF